MSQIYFILKTIKSISAHTGDHPLAGDGGGGVSEKIWLLIFSL